MLTGTLPLSMTKLTKLQVLLVHNNELTSNPDDAFHFIRKNSNITVLDIADNGFTGTIPDALFSDYLPNINTFSAGSNCFSGSLPSSICSATNLETLVLSGLGSSRLCQNDIWKDSIFSGYFNGFTARHHIAGTLPQCLFAMDKLSYLYLSGNRMLGELPDEISPVLQNVSLSYNALSGTLPSKLLASSNLTYLNLGHNRISGDLRAFDDYSGSQDDLDLTLKVNDLSGSIPKTLTSFIHIHILSGNMFGCSQGREELPINDGVVDMYQCGSNDFDQVLYIFVVLVILVALALVYYL